MNRARAGLVVLAAVVLVVPFLVGFGHVSAVQPLPESFCSPVVSGGVDPDYLIVSDLPVRAFEFRANTAAMQGAIKFVLALHHFQAGSYSIGYQACDDSNPRSASGDLAKCASNAKAYAQDRSVIGVIGTWSSHCSAVAIPILGRAPDGPLGMISPSNTNVGLTHAARGTQPGEPERYYPNGRNFVRVISPDDAQAAGDALLAKQLGLRRIFVLNDTEEYGLNVAGTFEHAARKLSLSIVGKGAWREDQTTFGAIAERVARSRPDAVFLGGFACPGCGQLIKDLHASLGSGTKIIAPDGFVPIAALVKATGGASEGLYVSVPGEPLERLSPLGRQIAKKFGPMRLGSGGSPYAAEAAEVLLAAIAKSNGTRASVTTQLFATRVERGIIGPVGFDKNGDPTFNPVMIFRVRGGKGHLDRVVTPSPSLIR